MDRSPAELDDIRSNGGLIEVNSDDVRSRAGAEHLVDQATRGLGAARTSW